MRILSPTTKLFLIKMLGEIYIIITNAISIAWVGFSYIPVDELCITNSWFICLRSIRPPKQESSSEDEAPRRPAKKAPAKKTKAKAKRSSKAAAKKKGKRKDEPAPAPKVALSSKAMRIEQVGALEGKR